MKIKPLRGDMNLVEVETMSRVIDKINEIIQQVNAEEVRLDAMKAAVEVVRSRTAYIERSHEDY